MSENRNLGFILFKESELEELAEEIQDRFGPSATGGNKSHWPDGDSTSLS